MSEFDSPAAIENGAALNCSGLLVRSSFAILVARTRHLSELIPDTKIDDGRHSEEGSRGGEVASAEERDLALAYLRLLPTLSRIDKYERIAVRRQRAVRKLCSAM